MRIVDGEAQAEQARRAAESAAQGGRELLSPSTAPARMLALLHRALPEGAVRVFVPAGPDQVERVLLELAGAVGGSLVEGVEQELARGPERLAPLLRELGSGLDGRPLLVDGIDELGRLGREWELRSALGPWIAELVHWLGSRHGVFLRRGWGRALPAGSEPPFHLVNGAEVETAALWEAAGGDATHYALLLAALALGAEPSELEGLSPAELRAELLTNLLPESVAAVLHKLAVHGRPLAPRYLEGAPPGALRLGEELGLWSRLGGELLVEEGWQDFVRAWLPREQLRRLHRELARSFLSGLGAAGRRVRAGGLPLLEAHRHFVEAGDFARARECWRHGATVLIAAARDRSKEGDYAGAAELYAQVVEAVDEHELGLPPRLRAYARHYLHFNRAHAGSEELERTERGYRAALEDWPENALFWSRLLRAVVLQGRLAEALDLLEQARARVPPHGLKETVLVARTVRGLLEHDRVLEAIQLWGDYQPDTPRAREVEATFFARLERGLDLRALVLEGEPPVFFTRELRLGFERPAGGWRALLRELDCTAEGRTPLEALRALLASLRAEASALLRAYSSDLSPRERWRKRLLLGNLDVLASRLGGAPPRSYWVYGTLQRDDDGSVWLHASGSRFRVGDELARELVLDGLPRLARVATDERGVPRGPVIELEEGFRGSPEELWERWRRRLGGESGR